MKYKILIILSFFLNVTFAQDEKASSKIIVEKFVENYNSNEYQAIFEMFSDEMKAALPLDKTQKFLSNLNTQAGKINDIEFVSYKNETYASYKVTFEAKVLLLNFSTDKNTLINGFYVKPYAEDTTTDENASEKVSNNLSTADSLITKKQTQLIYDNAKSFPEQTQLSIAMIKNGEVSYYGIIRNENKISSLENHKSIFEIGSITKVFTSTLLANFVVDGRINLDDYINDFLDISFNKDIKITFKQLANHTSGLPRLPSNLDLSKVNMENPYKDYSSAELEEYLTNHLELSPESIGNYQYSNLGAGLLGYTLSKIEGVSYENLLEREIFSKFEMSNSTTNINNLNNELIKGLDAEGNRVSNWNFSVLAGAGAILSNVDDLSKFAIAQFDTKNRDLKLTRQKTVDVNDNMQIGLGWHILTSQGENAWVWHNGGTGGYSSSMVIDVENKNGIIILSNVSAFNPKNGNIDNLCFELMKTLED